MADERPAPPTFDHQPVVDHAEDDTTRWWIYCAAIDCAFYENPHTSRADAVEAHRRHHHQPRFHYEGRFGIHDVECQCGWLQGGMSRAQVTQAHRDHLDATQPTDGAS